MEGFPRFLPPLSWPVVLPVEPRLESWMANGHPDQIALTSYLDAAEGALAEQLATLDGPIAVQLDVGLPEGFDLLDKRDLDNYLYPLAKRLSKSHRVVSMRGSKHIGSESTLAAAPAIVHDTPPAPQVEFSVTASSQTSAYKEQVRDGVVALDRLPDGPVALELAFVVGPRRNWLNLWKPTIDSLGAILGHTTTTREWHPLDGRITDLALHLAIDAGAGNLVRVGVTASSDDGTFAEE